MNNILWTIIILLVIALLAFLYFRFYKGDKINKILVFLVVLTIIGAVMFLVWFPREKWNDEDYFLGIAQMVGGLFTVIGVYFTIKEEEKMRKIDNKNADNKIKEQLRLENLPVLKFRCDNGFKYVMTILPKYIKYKYSKILPFCNKSLRFMYPDNTFCICR